MQTKIRKESDGGDVGENYVAITDYPTPHNQYEINCETCRKVLYADKEKFDVIERMIEQGLTETFLCNDCHEESLRLEFEDR